MLALQLYLIWFGDGVQMFGRLHLVFGLGVGQQCNGRNVCDRIVIVEVAYELEITKSSSMVVYIMVRCH